MPRISSKPKPRKRSAKSLAGVARQGLRTAQPVKPHVAGKRGPRLNADQRSVLLLLLAAGQVESVIVDVFKMLRWGRISSSTISYYRTENAEAIAAAQAKRVDQALSAGLALKAERVAALKEHAEVLSALRFQPDANGRLWNERAYRQTLEDIALELGDRKPKEQAGELVVKVYQGFDPGKV